MRCRFLILFLLFVVAVAASGCSSDSDRGTVEGTVTLDGQPLERGLIRFVPINGQTPTADATITAGKFSALVPVGEKRISFSAPKVVGKHRVYETPDSPTIDVIEERLPARYNVASKITLKVGPGRQNPEFKLESR